mgnify:CR=1 FL=1|jgi:hypothetical protein
MSKKQIDKFNDDLLKEIGDEDLFQDIFGLTMGLGENFWTLDADAQKEIMKDILRSLR